MYSWLKIDVTEIPLNQLSGTALKVYLAMACIMNDEKISQCSYQLLCKSLNISKRSAYRAVKELETLFLCRRINVPGQVLTLEFHRGVYVGRNSRPEREKQHHNQKFFLPDALKKYA